MWVIGLTGGIGSGKSTIARWFEEHEIPVLDADKIVHEMLSHNEETIQSVVQEFGQEVLNEQGQINRRVLGSIVFPDPTLRRNLENILHPRVANEMVSRQKKLESEGHTICVLDVPLLFEAGFDRLADETWVVWVPESTQVERVIKRDSLTHKEVQMRISSQLSLDIKAKKADIVINNSGAWPQTEEQLLKELARIKNKGLR